MLPLLCLLLSSSPGLQGRGWFEPVGGIDGKSSESLFFVMAGDEPQPDDGAEEHRIQQPQKSLMAAHSIDSGKQGVDKVTSGRWPAFSHGFI